MLVRHLNVMQWFIFAYAVFDQTNANAFKVNTQQITEHIDSKHGYIN